MLFFVVWSANDNFEKIAALFMRKKRRWGEDFIKRLKLFHIWGLYTEGEWRCKGGNKYTDLMWYQYCSSIGINYLLLWLLYTRARQMIYLVIRNFFSTIQREKFSGNFFSSRWIKQKALLCVWYERKGEEGQDGIFWLTNRTRAYWLWVHSYSTILIIRMTCRLLKIFLQNIT